MEKLDCTSMLNTSGLAREPEPVWVVPDSASSSCCITVSGGSVVPSCWDMSPPSNATYCRLFQAVVPSPTFNLLVFVSSPGSPAARVGLLLVQSVFVPLLTCMECFMTLCRSVLEKVS